MIVCIYLYGCLIWGQKSPTAKGKIETAFVRLDRLGLGEDGGGLVDARESMLRADLFTSVIPPLRINYALKRF